MNNSRKIALTPDIHVCLVYDTPISNITPALDPEFKPDEVILVYGLNDRRRAEYLRDVLKTTGVDVTYWSIDDSRNIEQVRDRILELVVERDNSSIALNASGGTRPMSLGAYEVFREFKKPIFFVHPETDEITWLHDHNLPSFNCADRIGIKAFLRAHGVKVNDCKENSIPINLRSLTEKLINNAANNASALSTLNWLAAEAAVKLISPELEDNQKDWSKLQEIIQLFQEEGLLEFRDNRLHFIKEENRFFVNGGWLENHTFGLLYGIRAEPKLRKMMHRSGIARDINISRNGIQNEIDVACLSNNHLYIIECKTKRFDKLEILHSQASEVLYKLSTLKCILGDIRAKVMMVSYHEISERDKNRAKNLDVNVVTASELPRLKAKLQRWLGG